MSGTATSTDLPKDQYQHYIPRFILRYFQDTQLQPRNKKERQKNFHKARKTGVDKDTILVYDIQAQKFEPRPIGKVHGIINLYRDQRNTQNVDHLEQGLSRLENDAARVIHRIHMATDAHNTVVTMKRKELETVRKFIYIMHYRQTHLVPSYFDGNDPENGPLRDYLSFIQKKHDLRTTNDIFLFGLKYVLETPHHEMVTITQALWEKYGLNGFYTMLLTRVDPEIVNFGAVDYASMASTFFLGIWQAAEGEEFATGNNSFGLWEGMIEGGGNIHRLFVVTPKIALVLRKNLFSDEDLTTAVTSNSAIVSSLVDIPTFKASSTYANFTPPRVIPRYANNAIQWDGLWAYRATPEAQEDVFTFKVTILTKKQTLALNHVILLHVPDDGNVTFASPAAMQRTIKSYLQSTTPYIHPSKYLYRSLFGILSEHTGNSGGISSTSPGPRSGIDIVLKSIESGAIEFASTYDRAYRVYHLATDDVSKYNETTTEIHQMTARAILKMKEILPPPPVHHRGRYFRSSYTLVQKLPKEESELFFALIGYQVDVLGVGPTNSDLASRIKYEAAIIGFTYWLCEYHDVLLFDRLSPWMIVMVRSSLLFQCLMDIISARLQHGTS
ncbi:hypothetical protein BDZ97DRAFT_1704752 [Flammula alnicola]|nr:hypothetical protein BDZ97DRAFT_1704752 [Flammula alnicola]